MKKNSLLLLLLIITAQTILAQDLIVPDTTIINKNWRDLKSALRSKTDLVARITRTLAKYPNVDKKQLNTSSSYALDLASFLDTLINNDSITINKLDLLNNNLTDPLSRTLATLQSNPQFTNTNAFSRLVSQWAGINSRIVYTRQTYNDICLQLNRSDLLFGRGENEHSP